jgi:hypothetical protein
VANGQENLIPMSERSEEEVRELGKKGGIASGEARREKATMKKTLELLLEAKNSEGRTYQELTTLGLIKGAIDGKAENYRTIVQLLGELEESKETPNVEIKIVDNTGLEKIMYEEKEEQ